MKRIVSAAVAAAMTMTVAATFSSCGKKGDVIASKEHVYSTETIALPEGLDYINQVLYSNEKLYFIGERSWSEKVNPADESYDGILPAATGSVEVAVTAIDVFADAPDEVQSVSDETEDDTDESSDDISETDDDSAETEGTSSDAVADEVIDEMYEEWHSETKLQIVALDGTLEKEVTLVSDEDRNSKENSSRYMSSASADKDGGIVCLYQEYTWDAATGSSETKYFLVRYSEDGDVIAESSLKAISDDNSDKDYYYISNIVSVGGGQYLTMTDNTMYLIDYSGAIVKKMTNENLDKNAWMSGIYETGDGRFVTYIGRSYEENGEWKSDNKIVEIDIENQQFGAEYEYKLNGSLMNGTDKYDLLITRDSGLVGYDIESGKTEIIIDWLKSGMDTSTLQRDTTTVLSDGRILCMTYDYTYYGNGSYGWGNDMILSILTEIPPETLPDKKLIKLYSLYLDMDVKRHILDFNKQSLEYEVELTSYYDYGYDEGITKMNNDMIAGNLPDIIILNSELPVDSYISKGLFANIYDFMDNDPEINRSDYLENIFKAYEVDGKLYEVVPTFSINTLIGKTSIVGDTQGWTMEEFINFVDSHPDSTTFPEYTTKDNILQSFIYSCYSSYINKETGECHFNTDNFIKLLEFCNRFVTKLPDDYWDNYGYDWDVQENELRSGKRLFDTYYLSQFSAIRELEQARFGEPITFKGMPGASGSGSAINANTTMAITSKANNSEGAWEFVKYFYSDEFQDQYANRNAYTFPIKLSTLEKQAEAAKERPYWENSDGEKEYYDNTYWIGGESINIGVNTDEDNRKVMDFIKSVDNVYRYDSNITKIISEEAGSYFEGQKSAAEVAEIIQNRVSNYIAESR